MSGTDDKATRERGLVGEREAEREREIEMKRQERQGRKNEPDWERNEKKNKTDWNCQDEQKQTSKRLFSCPWCVVVVVGRGSALLLGPSKQQHLGPLGDERDVKGEGSCVVCCLLW